MAGTGSIDDLLRLHNGRLYLGIRYGPLEEPIAHARPMTTLVRDAQDPIVQISFWHILAAALRLAARYSEAQDAVAEGLKESRSYALDFAQPHMLVTQAGAAIGVRRFAEATAILDRVQKLERKASGRISDHGTRAMRCRLLLTEGSPEAALAATSGSLLRVSSKGQKAEFLASRSLAYARIGALDRAQEFLRRPTD